MAERSRAFLLLVNPRAGGGRAERELPEVKQALHESGATFELAMTRAAGDGAALAREAITAGLGGVAVLGGDGTFNEAANGFFDSSGEYIAKEAWLSPISVGTGSDLRRTLSTRGDVRSMVTRMMWSRPRKIDLGYARFRAHDGQETSRYFVNVASFGLSGVIDTLMSGALRKMGSGTSLLLGTLGAVANVRQRRVRLSVDELPTRDIEMANVAIANGSYMGHGMRVAPDAQIDDGLFDVVGFERMGRMQLLALARHLYAGSVLGHEGVTHVRGRRVVVEPADWAGPLVLDLDGETPGVLPASFEIKPGALLLRF